MFNCRYLAKHKINHSTGISSPSASSSKTLLWLPKLLLELLIWINVFWNKKCSKQSIITTITTIIITITIIIIIITLIKLTKNYQFQQ